MPFIGRIGRPGLIGLAARTAVVAGTATAVSGGMAARQQRRAEDQYEQQQFEAQQQQAQMQQAAQQAVAQQAPPAAAGGDVTSELQRLAGLHQQGILTDEEFTAAKQKLLGL
ncbi:SHOCT domain-containing protein [Humibacter sp.]|uniref:SHOCT domain-containing protein n=1 Tax=Humibacter sp. TaxID=1940291 RepID=UPI003F7FC1CB